MVYYNKGQILVRNPDIRLTFHAGDELFNLLFISDGSKIVKLPNYDADGCECGQTTDTSPNIIDIVDGSRLNWGNHMVITVDQFKTFVINRRYIIDATLNSIDAIKHDDFSNSYRALQICNAIIRCANLYYKGLSDGEIYIPEIIDSIIQDSDIFSTPEEFGNIIKEIADIPMFDGVESEVDRFTKRIKEAEESNRIAMEEAEKELRQIEEEQFKEYMQNDDEGVNYEENNVSE